MLKDVSIDRLTLVGNFVESKLERLLNDDTFTIIKKRYRSQGFKYDWTYELFINGVLEVGRREGINYMRFDFNPNNIISEEHLNLIQSLIGCMKYVKFSRIDIAFDFMDIDINNYTIIDDLSRKTNTWNSGDGTMETRYIGAPTSDLRIRIYDKALEQGINGKWWRVEAQLRKEFAENYKHFNPFDSITLVNKSIEIKGVDSLKERVFIKHLLENPNDLNELAKNTRLKYKKILKELADSNSTLDLKAIYKVNQSDINYKLHEFIKHSYINNVI